MSLYTVSITNASGPNSVTIDTSTTPNSINISDGSTLAALSVNANVPTPLFSDSSPKLSANLNLNGNNITGSGDITTTGDITLTGDMVVSGDLTVNGTTTTLNTQTLDVEDINITVAFGAVDAASANGAGLTVDGADATLTYQSAGDNWALNKPLDVTGNVTVSGTVDGRDVAADGTKLDGIEASADVTDTTNVTAAGALMDSEVTNLAQVKAFDSADYATAAQGSTADSAVQPNDSPTFGSVTVTGTVDGRDVAADGTKLDGIEASANVTDTANVTAAGALMDSEVTNLAQVKAFDSADYATAAQGSTADSAVQPNDSPTFAGLTVDTDTLHVDATNDRVGIGLTTPDSTLHVKDISASPLTVERDNSSSNTSIKVANDTHSMYMGMTSGGAFAVDDDANLTNGPWFKVESDGTATATTFVGGGIPTLVRSGALTSANSMTYSHGQGSVPDLVWAELHITTADDNYSVGDVIKVYQLYEEDENDHALTVYGNATNLGLSQTGTDEVYRVSNRTSGSIATINSSSADIKLVGVWF